MNKKIGIKKYLTLFGGLSFMCFSAILIKSSGAPGIVSTFYRMGIAAVFLLTPFLIYLIRSKQKLPVKGILFAIAGGLCFSMDMAFWSTGVVASNATIPTIFANTAPIWVGFGSILLFRQKHKTGFWIGLLLAVCGIPIVVKNDLFSSGKIIFGALMGLGAGFFYGMYYLIAQSGRQILNTISFLFISSLTSSLVLAACVLIFGYNFTGYDRNTILIFLALGIGVQVMGWFLINYSQGFIPATIVAPTLLGQPLLTAFLATVFLHEHLTPWHIAGGSIVIAGIYVVYFNSRNK